MAFGDAIKSGLNQASDFMAAPGFGAYAKSLQASAKKLREGDTAAFGPGEGWKSAQKARIGSDVHKSLEGVSENLLSGMAAQGGNKTDGRAFEMAGKIAGEAGEVAAEKGMAVDKQALDMALMNKAAAQKALGEERMANRAAITGVMETLAGDLADDQDQKTPTLKEGTAKLLKYGLMAGSLFGCWVAREVLPGQWRDCRTYVFFGSPKWFRNWYLKNGEQTAEWLRSHPWAKVPVRPLFRYFAWRGRKMATQNPELIELQSHLP